MIWLLATAGPERIEDGSVSRLLESLPKRDVSCILLIRLDVESDPPLLHSRNNVVVLHGGRASASTARNQLLRHLEGLEPQPSDIVGFADDDSWFPTGFANTLTDSFPIDADVLCGVYGPSLESLDRRRFPGEPGPVGFVEAFRHPSSATTFYRYRVVREVGGFCEDIGPGTTVPSGEDVLYLIRALRLGYRAIYSPDVFVHHDYKVANRQRYAASGLLCLSGAALTTPALLPAATRRWVAAFIRGATRKGQLTLRQVLFQAARPAVIATIARYVRQGHSSGAR